MRKSIIIIHELLLSFGISICIAGWSSNDAMLYGPNLFYALQPIAAGLIWWIPSLVLLWLLEFLLIKLNRWAGVQSCRNSALKTLFPLYFTYIASLQPTFTYMSYGPILLIILLTGTFYINWININKQDEFSKYKSELEDKLIRAGNGRIALIIASLFIAVYVLLASAIISPLPDPEGDEPHYLITTLSMLTDGDLLLTNNYNEKDYALWHEGYIQPHTKAGLGGVSHQFPMHNVGLSAYLIPFMAAGLAFGSKAALLWIIRLGMVLLTAAFLAILYMLLSQVIGNRTVSLVMVLLTGITAPVLFYSFHIFTEIPAALLLTYALLILLRDKAPDSINAFLFGSALGSLPWLGIKYITLAFTFFIIWILKEYSWGFKLRRSMLTILPGMILGIWFLATTHAMFGTINPAAYQFGTDIDVFSRNSVIRISEASNPLDAVALASEALLAYLIGQHQGLLFYAPWMLLGLAGLTQMIHQGGASRKIAFNLLVLALPYMLIYAITGLGGGHSPPGRTMLPLLWFFLIPATWKMYKGIKAGKHIFAGLVIASIFIAAILLLHPNFLYHDFHVPSSHLLSWLSSPFLNITALFPSLFNRHFVNWDITMIWCVTILIIIYFWVFGKRKNRKSKTRGYGLIASCLLILLLFAYFVKTPPLHHISFSSDENLNLNVYFERGNVFIDPTGFWITSNSVENCFIVTEKSFDSVVLRLRSATPNISELTSNGGNYQIKLIDRLTRYVNLDLSGGFTSNNLKVTKLTVNSLGGNPEGIPLPSGDKRPLGVEISFR